MKTMMKATYYDCWDSYEALKNDYPECPPEQHIIYAGYTYEDWSGAALVVFHKEGKLFENNDSHCSCSGLESWKPEETSLGALRMKTGWSGLQEALNVYEKVMSETRIH